LSLLKINVKLLTISLEIYHHCI